MPAINLWSSPRNISTALMYSFAQRPDTIVFDEPLYAHYLLHTDTQADHPAREEILATMENDGEKVVRDLILGQHPRPVALFKQMTHHLIQLDEEFLGKTLNVLLIRDPRAIIASYAKVIPNPTIADVGVKKQVQLMQTLNQRGTLRAIVDTQDLLRQPEAMLRQLCARLDIPFYPSMLEWPPGPRPEDGVWAPYWYDRVHRSTGFMPYQPRHYPLTGTLARLAESCRPYYEELYQHALQVPAGPN